MRMLVIIFMGSWIGLIILLTWKAVVGLIIDLINEIAGKEVIKWYPKNKMNKAGKTA